MTVTILRGRVLTFVEEPQSLDDTASYRYWEDGEVEIEDGRITSVGPYDGAQVPNATIIDHRPHLILPGFIDAHIHYPQMQVIGPMPVRCLSGSTRTPSSRNRSSQTEAWAANRVGFSRYADCARNDHGGKLLHRASASVDAFFAEAEKRTC